MSIKSGSIQLDFLNEERLTIEIGEEGGVEGEPDPPDFGVEYPDVLCGGERTYSSIH